MCQDKSFCILVCTVLNVKFKVWGIAALIIIGYYVSKIVWNHCDVIQEYLLKGKPFRRMFCSPFLYKNASYQ